jgi:hypothetical protein
LIRRNERAVACVHPFIPSLSHTHPLSLLL